MNSNRIIRYLGLGFIISGIILTLSMGPHPMGNIGIFIPMFPLFIIGICLIVAGSGNGNGNEKISKKSLRIVNNANPDCPNCALARKVGLKYCQECGKEF